MAQLRANQTARPLPLATTIRATFVPSQKGTNLLQCENNFRYRINKDSRDGKLTYYQCVKHFKPDLKCPATAVYDKGQAVILKLTAQHNHGSAVLENFVR